MSFFADMIIRDTSTYTDVLIQGRVEVQLSWYFILDLTFPLTLIFKGKNGIDWASGNQLFLSPLPLRNSEAIFFSTPFLFTIRIMTLTIRRSNSGFLAQGSTLEKETWASWKISFNAREEEFVFLFVGYILFIGP